MGRQPHVPASDPVYAGRALANLSLNNGALQNQAHRCSSWSAAPPESSEPQGVLNPRSASCQGVGSPGNSPRKAPTGAPSVLPAALEVTATLTAATPNPHHHSQAGRAPTCLGRIFNLTPYYIMPSKSEGLRGKGSPDWPPWVHTSALLLGSLHPTLPPPGPPRGWDLVEGGLPRTHCPVAQFQPHTRVGALLLLCSGPQSADPTKYTRIWGPEGTSGRRGALAGVSPHIPRGKLCSELRNPRAWFTHPTAGDHSPTNPLHLTNPPPAVCLCIVRHFPSPKPRTQPIKKFRCGRLGGSGG